MIKESHEDDSSAGNTALPSVGSLRTTLFQTIHGAALRAAGTMSLGVAAEIQRSMMIQGDDGPGLQCLCCGSVFKLVNNARPAGEKDKV